MSTFKAKMHQIRFRLGLRPRPRWGNLQRSPDPLAGFKGSCFEGEGKGKGGEGRKGKREGEEEIGDEEHDGDVCKTINAMKCRMLFLFSK